MSADESGIHLLSNGRSPMRRQGDYITRGQAEQMVQEAVLNERVENEKMVKFYMMQLPGLVAHMLGDAMAANGLVLKGPDEAPAVPE